MNATYIAASCGRFARRSARAQLHLHPDGDRFMTAALMDTAPSSCAVEPAACLAATPRVRPPARGLRSRGAGTRGRSGRAGRAHPRRLLPDGQLHFAVDSRRRQERPRSRHGGQRGDRSARH
ncbi:MAG: hypothetical protein MZW92_23740 [Comamonadaceae bacterium]|nr:hypothetical protein [Comamonadaceae bacterium]